MTNQRRWVSDPGLFRLILAAVVVVNHSIPMHFGPAAVYLFFMLSGYWVYRMWNKEYSQARNPYFTFLISRLWRLLPVYYLTLALFLIGNYWFPAPYRLDHLPVGRQAAHFALSHTLLLGYATLPFIQKIVLPVWSLDIELQFYLVAPLLVLVAQGAGRGVRASLQNLGILFFALIGLGCFFRYYMTLDDQGAAWLPMYLIFFLIGLYTARFEWKPSPRMAGFSLLIALALVAACIALPASRSIFVGQYSGWMAAYNPQANLVLALVCAPYAMATLRKVPNKAGWLSSRDRDLGNITYEIYLLHWPVVSAMKHFTGTVHAFRQVPALLVAWLSLVPLCWLVYRFVDRPLDGMRRAFVLNRSREKKSSVLDLPVTLPANSL